MLLHTCRVTCTVLMELGSTTMADTPMPMPAGMSVVEGALSDTVAARACAVLEAAARVLDHMSRQSAAC